MVDYRTVAKKRVRLNYNLPLIKAYHKKYRKKSKYFGLAGKDLEDIIDWNEYIESALTVEYEESFIPDLIKNIQLNKLEAKVDYIVGDIIDLIYNNDDRINYPYDIVNLDFLGTFIYENFDIEKENKRIEIFKNLINHQSKVLRNGEGFLFFITLNGQRGRNIATYEEALKSLYSTIKKPEIEWLLSTKNEVKQYQKLAYILPCLLLQNCINKFQVKNFQIIIYQGNETLMVHFMFFLIKKKTSLIDLSHIDVDIISNSQILMISKEANEKRLKGTDFFKAQNPFRMYFKDIPKLE